MALAQIAQDDFAVGTLRGTARDVQSGVGAHRILNGLISDDGDVLVRGATRYASNTAVDGPIRWVWSGVLGDVHLTLLATATTFYYIDAVGEPFNLGPGGLPGPVLCAVIGNTLYLPTGQAITASGAVTVSDWALPAGLTNGTTTVASIAGRLVVARGNRIAFSPADSIVFAADDFHLLPGGVEVKGLFAIRDTLLVFTNFGLWSVSNMAFNLTDGAGNIQQTLSLLTPDLSLMGEGGLCGYGGGVVAACVDRVCIVDPENPPVTLSNSIAPLYRDTMMNHGFRPGGIKVFRDTLFVPFLNSSGLIQTVWTCRLSRPVRGRQIYYPWTELDGHAGQNVMFDYHIGNFNIAQLLGAGQDGRLSDLSTIFPNPDQALTGADADGTVPLFELETRDFPTGQGQPNHLKRLRVRYTGQASADVQVDVAYSTDPLHETWVDLGLRSLLMTGVDPIAYWLPQAERTRYARVRLRIQDPDLSFLTVHRIELLARTAAHAR